MTPCDESRHELYPTGLIENVKPSLPASGRFAGVNATQVLVAGTAVERSKWDRIASYFDLKKSHAGGR